MNRYKFPRTYHLPISLSSTSDDKHLKDYSNFEGKTVCIHEKLDGENFVGYSDGFCHARSIDSQHHESRNWAKRFLQGVAYTFPDGYRVICENLYAKHSIEYKGLKSYLYLLAVVDSCNYFLSVADTDSFAEEFGFARPTLLYSGEFNRDILNTIHKGTLNGSECEGYVIRNALSFPFEDWENETGKFVREGHVAENEEHWMHKTIIKNQIK